MSAASAGRLARPKGQDSMTKPAWATRVEAAWQAFGAARNTIYARLFIDLRPGLLDVGDTKTAAVVEAGKRWEALTTLPALYTRSVESHVQGRGRRPGHRPGRRTG